MPFRARVVCLAVTTDPVSPGTMLKFIGRVRKLC
jgi:hypothetical protein